MEKGGIMMVDEVVEDQMLHDHDGYMRQYFSNGALLEINKQFLGHDYYTDIITFDYCQGDKLSGELYISIDTVKANAVEYEQEFTTELHRVIIHGILHLIGFDDHSDEDIAQMRRGEDQALALLQQMLSE